MIQFGQHIFQRGWNHQLHRKKTTGLNRHGPVKSVFGWLEEDHSLGIAKLFGGANCWTSREWYFWSSGTLNLNRPLKLLEITPIVTFPSHGNYSQWCNIFSPTSIFYDRQDIPMLLMDQCSTAQHRCCLKECQPIRKWIVFGRSVRSTRCPTTCFQGKKTLGRFFSMGYSILASYWWKILAGSVSYQIFFSKMDHGIQPRHFCNCRNPIFILRPRFCSHQQVSVFYTAPTAIRSLMKSGDEPVTRNDLSSLRPLRCWVSEGWVLVGSMTPPWGTFFPETLRGVMGGNNHEIEKNQRIGNISI